MFISAKEVRQRLKGIWPNLKNIWLFDKQYELPTKDQIEDFIDGHYFDAPVHADCDDYALQLHAYVKRKRPQWAFGEATGKKIRDIKAVHSLNIAITETKVYLIEPQLEGLWLADSKLDDIFFVKM